MRHLKPWSLLLWCACLALGIATTAHAGGVQVDRNSVEFVDGPSVVDPRTRVTVRFRVAGYFYGSHEWAYLAVAVVPDKESMSPTPKALEAWDIYGVMTGTPEREIGLAEAALPYVFSFNAPETPGEYKVVLGGVPWFRNTQFKTGAGYKEFFVPHTTDRRELASTIAQYPGSVELVARFKVSAVPVAKDESPAVYLRMNGKIPSDAKTPGGLQDKPITFSWNVGPEFKKDPKRLLYRYRLEPEDDDWGAWTAQQQVDYSFLLKGIHQFRVQAKYADATVTLMSAPAVSQFALPMDHVSRPTRETLTKAPFGVAAQDTPSIAFGEVYVTSRALLVGMWSFDDAAHFPQFDEAKISADIGAMESALRRNNFQVTVLKNARVSREDITSALAALVDASGRDDRLFVYFSTHGFPDPVLPSEGYLATSDCELARPTVRCLRLNELQASVDRALDGKRVRQVLFAVDSCFSGLGIARKSVGVPDMTRLAVPQGAFMLTAGMANQLAQIDPGLGMSTFTHYLAEGLNGQADILGNNGLITLSELFVYVQYKVAEKTGAQQIPMLGRMKGDGEMLFLPAPAPR